MLTRSIPRTYLENKSRWIKKEVQQTLFLNLTLCSQSCHGHWPDTLPNEDDAGYVVSVRQKPGGQEMLPLLLNHPIPSYPILFDIC